MIGLLLTVDTADQFQRGVPWDVTPGPGGVTNSWGGHGVLGVGYARGQAMGYNKDGIRVMSWAEEIFVSWDLVRQICDECYVLFDEHDSWNPEIIIAPVVTPPEPRPIKPRPQTDEHHDSKPGEGADIAVGVKPGWSHDDVREYFYDLAPVAGTLQASGDDLSIENWRVGDDKYTIYYTAVAGVVNGVTRTMGAYTGE